MFLHTNEIVFRGHPDKLADQISDAVLDYCLEHDRNARCAVETLGKNSQIYICGEISSPKGWKIDADEIKSVAKATLLDAGCKQDYDVTVNISEQSSDIASAMEDGGAGDQGIVYGYACHDSSLPVAELILQDLAKAYDELRKKDERFLPDGKAQITAEYSDDSCGHGLIKSFLVSYQSKDLSEKEHKETDQIIRDLVCKVSEKYSMHLPILGVKDTIVINPSGRFVIGGFEADTGLTGRKIAVDTYHTFAHVGGGAFSGKDMSKVDRSGAYFARALAKAVVDELGGLGTTCEVEIAYQIGRDFPLGITLDIKNGAYHSRFSLKDDLIMNLARASVIKQMFNQDGFKYVETAKFGHFGNADFPWEKEIPVLKVWAQDFFDTHKKFYDGF